MGRDYCHCGMVGDHSCPYDRIAELEADGVRLDWLEETEASVDARTDGQWEATQWHGTEHHSSVGATVRATIDAAMSED